MVSIAGDLYGKSKEGKTGFDLKIITKKYKSMVLNYRWQYVVVRMPVQKKSTSCVKVSFIIVIKILQIKLNKNYRNVCLIQFFFQFINKENGLCLKHGLYLNISLHLKNINFMNKAMIRFQSPCNSIDDSFCAHSMNIIINPLA